MNNQYDVYLCRERVEELTERERQLLDNFLEEKTAVFKTLGRYIGGWAGRHCLSNSEHSK